MADTIKELYPETIQDQPFPGIEQGETTGFGSVTNNKIEISPNEIPERQFPAQTIANEVISSSFDSQSRKIMGDYEFSQKGSLQIGKFVEGESGDIRISPSGILGRDIDGETTFTIDATTGDATFRGTIAANSLIAGRTDIGEAGGNVYIDGDEARIIISDGTNDRILLGKQTGGF